jgi:hypothetical protein
VFWLVWDLEEAYTTGKSIVLGELESNGMHAVTHIDFSSAPLFLFIYLSSLNCVSHLCIA